MKKYIAIFLLVGMVTLPGCSMFHGKGSTQVPATQAWWGTKEEIKTFLDSPQAQAKRWYIESIGE
jgi:hypothetical protein